MIAVSVSVSGLLILACVAVWSFCKCKKRNNPAGRNTIVNQSSQIIELETRALLSSKPMSKQDLNNLMSKKDFAKIIRCEFQELNHEMNIYNTPEDIDEVKVNSVLEAFWVRGNFNKRDFISMTMPSQDEIPLFWQMVFTDNIHNIVTMEDIIETLLGLEIMDESDAIEDMQAAARKNWERRAKRMGIELQKPASDSDKD